MNATPENVAREVRVGIAAALRQAKTQAVAAATDALVRNGQVLAAYHVLRQSGLPEPEAFEVIEAVGAGAELLELLYLPDAGSSGRPESWR